MVMYLRFAVNSHVPRQAGIGLTQAQGSLPIQTGSYRHPHDTRQIKSQTYDCCTQKYNNINKFKEYLSRFTRGSRNEETRIETNRVFNG